MYLSALYSQGLPISCSRLEQDYWEEIINLKNFSITSECLVSDFYCFESANMQPWAFTQEEEGLDWMNAKYIHDIGYL